jgi:hypothetical protein
MRQRIGIRMKIKKEAQSETLSSYVLILILLLILILIFILDSSSLSQDPRRRNRTDEFTRAAFGQAVNQKTAPGTTKRLGCAGAV